MNNVTHDAYQQVEAANKRRIKAKSKQSLYDWCKYELRKKKKAKL